MTDERPSLDALRIDRQPERAPRRRWPWLVALLVVLAAAALLWWRLGGEGPPRVETAVVREQGGAAPAVLDASGYVTARREATVSSKITGKISEVLVEEGMDVADDQVLARLDDTTQRAALRVAKANLEAARGAQAETEVRLAKARLDLSRMEDLAGKKVVAQADLDSAHADADALQAQLALQREQVQVADSQVAAQKVALNETVIRAPFAGVAISKNAQPGEMISPVSAGGGFTRTGICTVVDMSSLEIEVDVGESYIQRVHQGQRVTAVLDAYPDWQVPARVITTIPAADREKATVKVRIAFDHLDPRILPDMGVKVSFLSDAPPEGGAARPRSQILVPRKAVRSEEGRDVVWLVRGGRLERRVIKLGAKEGDDVQVLSGLTAGERVMTQGPEAPADGQEVEVADR
jgi:RND family efflux transporter MFP subunit